MPAESVATALPKSVLVAVGADFSSRIPGHAASGSVVLRQPLRTSTQPFELSQTLAAQHERVSSGLGCSLASLALAESNVCSSLCQPWRGEAGFFRVLGRCALQAVRSMQQT